jgi:39S mitochondrial ribosomal protein L46
LQISAEFTFNSPVLNLRRVSSAALAQDAVQPKWDLVSSVCLERKPIISADLNEVEAKMQNVLNKVCITYWNFYLFISTSKNYILL